MSAGTDPGARINATIWRRSGQVRHYADSTLRPVEARLLETHAGALAGRVLELGSGAGRITGHLAELSDDVQAIDLDADMVDYARRRYPRATFRAGDLRDLSGYADGSLDAVVAGWNVIDVVGDAERRRLLGEIRRLLVPGGLLIFSSHNRAAAADVPPPTRLRVGHPLTLAADLVHLPRRVRNRRRLAPLQADHGDHAIVNDGALDYALLHYYIGRDDQERQLTATGFELIECLDLDGRPVPPGAAARHSSELHYVARAIPRPRPETADPA